MRLLKCKENSDIFQASMLAYSECGYTSSVCETVDNFSETQVFIPKEFTQYPPAEEKLKIHPFVFTFQDTI